MTQYVSIALNTNLLLILLTASASGMEAYESGILPSPLRSQKQTRGSAPAKLSTKRNLFALHGGETPLPQTIETTQRQTIIKAAEKILTALTNKNVAVDLAVFRAAVTRQEHTAWAYTILKIASTWHTPAGSILTPEEQRLLQNASTFFPTEPLENSEEGQSKMRLTTITDALLRALTQLQDSRPTSSPESCPELDSPADPEDLVYYERLPQRRRVAHPVFGSGSEENSVAGSPEGAFDQNTTSLLHAVSRRLTGEYRGERFSSLENFARGCAPSPADLSGESEPDTSESTRSEGSSDDENWSTANMNPDAYESAEEESDSEYHAEHLDRIDGISRGSVIRRLDGGRHVRGGRPSPYSSEEEGW